MNREFLKLEYELLKLEELCGVGLTATDKLVYSYIKEKLALYSKGNGKQKFFESQSLVASSLGVSVKSVNRAYKKICDLGLLDYKNEARNIISVSNIKDYITLDWLLEVKRQLTVTKLPTKQPTFEPSNNDDLCPF